MRVVFSNGLPPGLWLAPGLLGLTLLLFGILVVVMPELLAYLVAGLFIMAGVSLIGWSLRLAMRRGVVYRRLDEDEMVGR